MAMKIKCNQCGAEWKIQKTDYDPSYLRCPNGCEADPAPTRKLTREEAAALAMGVYATSKPPNVTRA